MDIWKKAVWKQYNSNGLIQKPMNQIPTGFFTEEECIGDHIRIYGEESMGQLRLDTRTIDTPTSSDILYMSFIYLLRSDLSDISGFNENFFNPFTWEEKVDYFTQEAIENVSMDRVINLSSKFVLRAIPYISYLRTGSHVSSASEILLL